MSGRRRARQSVDTAIPPSARKRSRVLIALATVMVCIAAPFVSVGPASAAVGMGVTADFPTNVVVGQAGIPITYSISNVSDGNDADDPTDIIRLDTIRLVPSCGVSVNVDPPCTTAPDPGVFALSATGVGEAGTACAGKTFNITQTNPATGEVSFVPTDAMPVLLQRPGQPGDTCRIIFTVTVLRVPTLDSRAAAGIQTDSHTIVTGTNLSNGSDGGGLGNDFTTVAPATPTIATLVSPPVVPPATTPTVNVGMSFTDTATITGVANGPTPGGTVTFAYFLDPPGTPATTCVNTVDPPIVVGTVAVTGPAPTPPTPPTGTATSPAVVAAVPGTYHFVATYSGDANYTALATTACGLPGENVIVLAEAGLTTLAASSNPAAPPGTATVPETVSDTAVVTGTAGGPAPTGSVIFTRYFDAPGAAMCSGPSEVTGAVPLVTVAPATNPPSATATSPAFAPTGPGTVRYRASYSGDGVYSPVPITACGAQGENVTIQAVPTLVTLAASSNPAAPPGTATTVDTVTDTATVTGSAGGPAPTGSVTFTRFFDAPGAALCSGPSTVIGPVALTPVAPATDPPTSTAATPGFAPPGPGTVRYLASYSGDANYTALPNTACGDPGENVTVTAMPTLVTLARSSNPADPAGTASPGATVSDTATVTGTAGGPAPTGTVTFTRFFDAPGAALCSGPSTVLAPVALTPVTPATTPPSATATTPAFTPPGPGTVRYLASYSGDASYSALPDSPCGAPGENVTVQVLPSLVTLAASSNPADPPGTARPGATVSDTATVTGTAGGSAPTGFVTFTRFFDAPGAALCSGPSTVLAPVALTPVAPATTPPSATATSPAFTPPGPGTVRFLARYGGDASYVALPDTPCGAPGENVTVQAAPALTTLAASSNPADPAGTASPGAAVGDTATVTGVAGGPAPTGTVTFTRYFDPPGAAPCSSAATVQGPLTLAPVAPATTPPSSTVAAPPFTPPGPGTVRYLASYSGDTFYSPLPDTPCGEPGENVTVLGAPSIVTLATSSNPLAPAGTAALGDTITDTATVTGVAGGPTPTGTVTFTRFLDAPGAALCSGPATGIGPVPLTAVTPATSPPSARAATPAFAPTSPGTVRFVASYSGDAFYAALPTTACGEPGENVTVPLSTPGLVTRASAGTVGGEVTDTAFLTGGFQPTGTIRFDLYNNETCTGPPVFTDTVTVAGNGEYTTRPFILPAAGIYHFVATYSGDANNNAVGPTDCLDPLETVGVGVLPTSISTRASGPVNVGQQISDTATLSGGLDPTGVLAFRLFGPDNDDCSGAPIFISNRTVTGNGVYVSEPFTPTLPGTYRWVAVYSGDLNNAGAETPCDDPLEQVVVSPAPTIAIVKTATPLSLPVPGGTFTFDLVVTNTSNVALTITSLTDDIYGDVTTRANSTCTNAIGTVLAPSPGPGNTYSCRFDGTFFNPTPAEQIDTATVVGVDNRNNTVTATDDAVVRLTPRPTIAIVKTANPLSLPVPGGTFTFSVVVTNTSGVPLTIRTLTDDIYGDITRIPGSTCNTAIGTVLAPTPGPGHTYSCAFPGVFTGPAGAAQTDVVTVTATDDQGTTVTASDDAVVTITPVPTISTTKTPSPTSLPEPGGTFTFNYSVTNTGPEAVTITAIVDDIYGNLHGRGTCAIGARLLTGQTYTCSFAGNFFGNAGATQTDTITTTARDDRGQEVVSISRATVTITDVPPSIRIVKSADPLSRPEPGGIFRFTVVVTNTSFEPITITSLVDDIYGDLNGRGSCAVGIRLAPNGGSYSCAFDGEFRGKAGDAQTDTVIVIAIDDDGTTVTAQAQAKVTITPVNVPPVVQPPPPPIVIQSPPKVLVRTGGSLAAPARVAGIMLLVGMTLIAATHKFGNIGAGLALVPTGRGPRPGGGGRGGRPDSDGPQWFGDDGWFGGARIHPPRPPKGGAPAGLFEPPPLPEVEELAWDDWVGERRVFAAPTPEPDVAAPATPALAPPPAPSELAFAAPAELDAAPPVLETRPAPAVEARAVIVEPTVPDAVVPTVPEAVVPNVVVVRATGALDAAALDAADAGPADHRPQGPPSGGRPRRRGSR